MARRRGWGGDTVLLVDRGAVPRDRWRRATVADLAALEPMVADGWRFVEERHGILGYDGKRLKP